ncbi:MAG TPA: AMP-binding protein [Candidatus Dormibacteraeota bacterium]|nr:AMP-binding protein [Candidatus Dormibacteraeota bacterium]
MRGDAGDPAGFGLTVGSAFLAAAARVPSRVAITFEGRDLTYKEVRRRSGRLAAGLLGSLGCRHGDRVGVLLPNCPEFLLAVLGIARAGLVAVPLPAAATAREVRHLVEDSGLRVLLTGPAAADRLGDELPDLARAGVAFRDAGGLVESATGNVADLGREDEPFFIGYTSGTTGRPKGAVVGHRARTLLALLHGQEYGCYTPGEHHLIATPMYHGAGLSRALAPLLSGASLDLQPGFDPERVVREIAAGQVTATFMVPAMFASILDLPAAVLDLGPGRLRTVLSNASALPEHLKLRILERWPGVRLFEIYGSTEAGTVTSLRPEDQLRKQRCVGLPLPLTELRIAGEDGADAAPGEVGGLRVRSPFLFSGYHGDRRATEEVMRDGHLTTGDIARLDEEGYVYIVGRVSDVVITGGVNVYPREVEEYLAELAGVREAVVLGLAHPRWGEAVHAVIVPQPGGPRPSVDALIAHCRRGLAPAKIPKGFSFEEALPLTASGKVARKQLAERLQRSAMEGERHVRQAGRIDARI